MERFSCYWKNVRLKHPLLERLKKASKSFSCYWKNVRLKQPCNVGYPGKIPGFSCYWKNVRLKPMQCVAGADVMWCFSCYWKNVRLKPRCRRWHSSRWRVSVVIERMYDWSLTSRTHCERGDLGFSCYWKNVRLKLRNQLIENKRFLTVGFWSVFRKWSICTKSAIIFENLGWLLDCFW